MPLEFKKAERKKAKLRLALVSPSGGGKTLTALLIAKGIGGKVALVDTENGSGALYAGEERLSKDNWEYQTLEMNAPYEPKKYIRAIKEAAEQGFDTIILDSLSHAWAGSGGLLDKHGALADRGGNSFAAWRKVTPDHNALIDAIIQAPIHVIATMRAKTDYSMDGGRVTKLGLAPVQRDGMEYEFTTVLDLDMKHKATASKDRTGLFDNKIIDMTTDAVQVGEQLINWLEN